MEKGSRKKKGMTFIPYDYEAAFEKNIEDLHEFFVEQLLKNRYKCVYALKEITAGEQFEVEIYPEFRTMDDVPETGRVRKDNAAAQRNLNDKNARKYVERLLNHNFDNNDIWITLTYGEGEEPETMEQAIRNMQNYIRRINYQRRKRGLPAAKYIYITEHSPDTEIRWHHHLIMDGLLDMDTVEAVWKKGRRNETRRLEKDEHGLTGMSIYITKEKDRKKGEKRWNCSQNLKQFRVRKVHSKPPAAGKGGYKPIGKYVDGFVKDRANIEEQMTRWYPDFDFTDSGVYYNDFNGMFYIRARMRRKTDGKEEDKKKRQNMHRVDCNRWYGTDYSNGGGSIQRAAGKRDTGGKQV
ncbi:rolling circle replication-associated protein [Eisenbergiella sp.]